MAMRAGLLRRYFSMSRFSSQTTAAANAKTEPVPSTTIFISGLCKRTTSERLHEEASKYGEVVHGVLLPNRWKRLAASYILLTLMAVQMLPLVGRVVLDRFSGFSEGYGFVKYATIAQAEQGIKGLDGQFVLNSHVQELLQGTRLPEKITPAKMKWIEPMDLPSKLLETSLKGEIVEYILSYMGDSFK